MPRRSVFTLTTRMSDCKEFDGGHPGRLPSTKRPRTSLSLRVFEIRQGSDHPVAGALVSITDERATVIAGMTDSSGRVSLKTGRSVVPIGRLAVTLSVGDGKCSTGVLTGLELERLYIDPSIDCNSTLRLHFAEEIASVA